MARASDKLIEQLKQEIFSGLLKPGDHLDIAPHRRHRVESTAVPTVWLAVHYD